MANGGDSDIEIDSTGMNSLVPESGQPARGLRVEKEDGSAVAVGATSDRTRIVKVARTALATTLGLLVLAIVPQWVIVLVPEWLFRRLAIAFLWVVAGAYYLSLVGAVVAVMALGPVVVRRRRRGRSVRLAARCLLLAITVLLGLGMLEGAGAAWKAWSRKAPELPTRFKVPRDPGELNLIVIGESSARGEPYHPWLSVGQIVGWQLERVAPGRRVNVDVRAAGGICLEQAVTTLRKGGPGPPPDAIIIYAGHNEFLARYAWDHNVRHYVDEAPEPTRIVEQFVAAHSWFGAFVIELIERNRIPLGPPPKVTRSLVDHPTCTPKEYAYLRSEYGHWLEFTLAYCERIGALPIVVIPPGNERDFPPRRSILPPQTSQTEREAFARAFEAAILTEQSGVEPAVRAYEQLLADQPGFAETHFRLARLEAKRNRWDSAATHYQRAYELDAMPMRCPRDFQEVARAVAARHRRAIVVDGPALFRTATAHGILDGTLFHDAQHPNLNGYRLLAQDIVRQLGSHSALRWPKEAAVPEIDLRECISHFALDTERWREVCMRTASFYRRTAYSRYDPSDNLAWGDRYQRAAETIVAGTPPEKAGVNGLGAHSPTASE